MIVVGLDAISLPEYAVNKSVSVRLSSGLYLTTVTILLEFEVSR